MVLLMPARPAAPTADGARGTRGSRVTMAAVHDADVPADVPVHVPVLRDEVRTLLAGGDAPAGAAGASGLLVDCTVGLGGHAEALLSATPPGVHLLGLDRDADALALAARRLAPFGARVHLHHTPFDLLAQEVDTVAARACPGPVLGVLYDLGVSSLQLERAPRGFSFLHDAPLDMRMDRSTGVTAAELLAGIDEGELATLLRTDADEPHARRIARAVVSARPTTTGALAEAVAGAVPAFRRRGPRHPATQTFQALRIAVNGELTSFRASLPQALELTAAAAAAPSEVGAPRRGGRIVTLAYHSGEDRIAKRLFTDAARGCVCPPGLPVCVCDHRPTHAHLEKGRGPDPAEADANPRSRSARLRAVEALPGDRGEG